MLSQNKAKYSEILAQMEELNLGADMSDLTQKCLNSLKKLKLTRAFAKIDDEIFSLGLDNLENNKTDFFTDLLYLETSRLKFKEEVNKCLSSQKTQVTNK